MAPPCFLINVIYHGFITNNTIHSHPEAIIYLFFISIGQKSICQPCRLLAQEVTRRLWEFWSTASTCQPRVAGQKSASPGSQGNSQTSGRSACVYAKDKHQQGLLGIANTGKISVPILHRDSDYSTLAVPLEFIEIGRYWHPVPYATTQFCRIHYTPTHNHLVQNAKSPPLQEL